MASTNDRLRILPPELRHFIYSHLLLGDGDGDGKIRIEQKHIAREWGPHDKWLPAILALPEDPIYLAFRQGKPNKLWPDAVDDAYFQALRWIIKECPPSRHLSNGRSRKDIMSEIICELTGATISRKHVSSHTQALKFFPDEREAMIAQYADSMQVSYVPESRTGASQEDPTIFTRPPNSPSNTVSKSGETLYPHCDTFFGQDFLSLSLVNRFYRAECLDHLASNMEPGGHVLQHFRSTDPAEILSSMRHVCVTLVDGYMPRLPEVPGLPALTIDLWPRNPTRPNARDRAWGTQTEALLAGLGVTFAVRAKITIEMRWAADCERFEREYVAAGCWRRVTVDGEDIALVTEKGFCRRRYEMCGNGRTLVEVPREEEFSIFVG